MSKSWMFSKIVETRPLLTQNWTENDLYSMEWLQKACHLQTTNVLWKSQETIPEVCLSVRHLTRFNKIAT